MPEITKSTAAPQEVKSDLNSARQHASKTGDLEQVKDKVFDKLLSAFRKFSENQDITGPYLGPAGHFQIQNLEQIFAEVVQKASEVTDTNTGIIEKLKLELFPKELGRLDVEITLIGKQMVSIAFYAETEIKKVLKDSIYKLEKSLTKEGISARIVVEQAPAK
ncbi:MAG: flagellar hook-length control protein FliK [Candidatus Margulisiibacteriota bacterium]|jgi:flagellar hook-length control protein FliK